MVISLTSQFEVISFLKKIDLSLWLYGDTFLAKYDHDVGEFYMGWNNTRDGMHEMVQTLIKKYMSVHCCAKQDHEPEYAAVLTASGCAGVFSSTGASSTKSGTLLRSVRYEGSSSSSNCNASNSACRSASSISSGTL